MHKLEIVDAPTRRLFAVGHRGPYTEIGPAFGRLADLLCEHGLNRVAGELVGVYYDDPDATVAADLRAHAGATMSEDSACPPGLEEVRIAAGPCAVVRVRGPYSGLYPAYVWLYGEGLSAAGKRPSDAPSYEVYRNDPADTAAGELITDIFVPLA